jgi:hypothetical protein
MEGEGNPASMFPSCLLSFFFALTSPVLDPIGRRKGIQLELAAVKALADGGPNEIRD